MGMKILWTDEAVSDLENIFAYYLAEASFQVATTIVNDIVDAAAYLEINPNSGQREALLNDREHEYRYLVEGNYKIIYWIDSDMINVATVFDCRQNPVKMIKE